MQIPACSPFIRDMSDPSTSGVRDRGGDQNFFVAFWFGKMLDTNMGNPLLYVKKTGISVWVDVRMNHPKHPTSGNIAVGHNVGQQTCCSRRHGFGVSGSQWVKQSIHKWVIRFPDACLVHSPKIKKNGQQIRILQVDSPELMGCINNKCLCVCAVVCLKTM